MLRRLFFAVFLTMAAASVAWACPNCKEAVASAGDNEDDPFRESRAYNYSIYFMLAVPYSLLGGGGFVAYRMYRSARKRPAVDL